jgi:hypothetical protein
MCEGWCEVYFEYVPKVSGNINDEPVYLHVDFDSYKPILMITSREKFYIYLVCPPGSKVQYFFSNPCLGIYTHAHNQKAIETNFNDEIRNEKLSLQYGKR